MVSKGKKNTDTAKKMVRRRKTTKGKGVRLQPDYGILWLPVCIVFLMLSGLAVFFVWERIEIREIDRDIVSQRRVRTLLVEGNERLRGQVEELTSYRRIYRIATERYGFVELKPQNIYVSRAGGR